MKLDQLKKLYKDMKSKDIDRAKFSFSFREKQFEAIYFIDQQPHSIAIGILKENFYFEVTVNPGFNIIPWIDNLTEFYKIMGFQNNSYNKFQPSVFFQELNINIPEKVNEKNKPEPYEIAHYRIPSEDPDKIYHVGWFDNEKVGKQVQPENLQKTRDFLSTKAYKMCEEKNISSCWSANPPANKKSKLPF